MKNFLFKILLGLVLFNYQDPAQGSDNGGWPGQGADDQQGGGQNNNQGGGQNNNQGGGQNNNQGGGQNNNQGGGQNNNQGGGQNNNQGGGQNNNQGGGQNNNQGGGQNNNQGGGQNNNQGGGKKSKNPSSQNGQQQNIVQGKDITPLALTGVSSGFQTLSPTPAPAVSGSVVPKSHIDEEDFYRRIEEEFEKGYQKGYQKGYAKALKSYRKNSGHKKKRSHSIKKTKKPKKKCICIE